MKAVVVAGARPNFMKVAPILTQLEARGHAACLVHTGQHYDASMSGAFFVDLGLPEPKHSLGVGSGTHAEQTARVMLAFEPVLLQERPDWVVVVGDVNSTLACSLVVAKLRGELGVRLAHVEAGLRSRNWAMPEEINRILTDQIADLLLTPSPDGETNLVREGIPGERIEFVGNVMIDSLLSHLPRARQLDLPCRLGLHRRGYAVVTLHRPANVDDAETLGVLFSALACIAEEMPVVLPLHPRTRENARRFGLADTLRNVQVVEPVGYSEMVSLVDGAAVVLTDSGGLQEETTALGIPCVTLRAETERPITISEGTNRLVPWPLRREGILKSFHDALKATTAGGPARAPAGWDGRAAERIVAALESRNGTEDR